MLILGNLECALSSLADLILFALKGSDLRFNLFGTCALA
jgi:hypothetical protein